MKTTGTVPLEERIAKDAVVAFVITKEYDTGQGKRGVWIRTVPVTVSWDGAASYPDLFLPLEEGEDVAAIVPAPVGAYEVSGEMPDGEYEPLGLELPGAYHPDWEQVRLQKEAEWREKSRG